MPRTLTAVRRSLLAAPLLALAWASAAFAQQQPGIRDNAGLTTSAQEAGFLTTGKSLPAIIGSLVGALLSLLGMVFVVLVIYGGFLWMTAQGEQDKIKKAKGVITSAVIGLVVIFASYGIASAVIGALSSATS